MYISFPVYHGLRKAGSTPYHLLYSTGSDWNDPVCRSGNGRVWDTVWAPVSGFLFFSLFGGRSGITDGVLNFPEEIIPFTDIIPSFTIAWFIKKLNGTNDLRGVSHPKWVAQPQMAAHPKSATHPYNDVSPFDKLL